MAARSPEPPPAAVIEALLQADVPRERMCPVDRLPRRWRNLSCIAIIAFGLLNLVAYTVIYAFLGGDAPNGDRVLVSAAGEPRRFEYTVRGHFLRQAGGIERHVSRATWIYSYAHSISIPLTSGLMIISMLVLARPHILATMRGTFVKGELVITLFSAVVLLMTVALTGLFIWDFVRKIQQVG